MASGADGHGAEDGLGGFSSGDMKMASVPVLARWFGRSISEATDLTIEDQLLMTKHLKGTLITKEVNETIMNLELSLGTHRSRDQSDGSMGLRHPRDLFEDHTRDVVEGQRTAGHRRCASL